MRTPTNNDEEKKLSLLLGKVEALTVDSASDELLAGQLLTGGPRRDAAIAPNLKLVIRDVTHASRRPHILLHGKQNRQREWQIRFGALSHACLVRFARPVRLPRLSLINSVGARRARLIFLTNVIWCAGAPRCCLTALCNITLHPLGESTSR